MVSAFLSDLRFTRGSVESRIFAPLHRMPLRRKSVRSARTTNKMRCDMRDPDIRFYTDYRNPGPECLNLGWKKEYVVECDVTDGPVGAGHDPTIVCHRHVETDFDDFEIWVIEVNVRRIIYGHHDKYIENPDELSLDSSLGIHLSKRAKEVLLHQESYYPDCPFCVQRARKKLSSKDSSDSWWYSGFHPVMRDRPAH